jgi:hypothetical protein
MKSESANTRGQRRLIDPCALINAPDNCEIGMNAKEGHGASETVTPWLRLMD